MSFLLEPCIFCWKSYKSLLETMSIFVGTTLLFCWNHGFCFNRRRPFCVYLLQPTTLLQAASDLADRRRQDAGDGGDKRRPPAWGEVVAGNAAWWKTRSGRGRRFPGVVTRACEAEDELCVDQSNEIQPFETVPSNARQRTGRKFGPMRRRQALPLIRMFKVDVG